MHAAKGWRLAPLSEGVDENAIYCSKYYFQIEKYVGAFSRSQILLITYEQLTDKPQATLDQVCRHFGVSTVQFVLPRTNMTKLRYMPLLLQTLEASIQKALMETSSPLEQIARPLLAGLFLASGPLTSGANFCDRSPEQWRFFGGL
jgi:hypothetical protein